MDRQSYGKPFIADYLEDYFAFSELFCRPTGYKWVRRYVEECGACH